MVRFFHPLLTLIASATRQELVAQVPYLNAETEILRSKPPRRVHVTRAERTRLVEARVARRGDHRLTFAELDAR